MTESCGTSACAWSGCADRDRQVRINQPGGTCAGSRKHGLPAVLRLTVFVERMHAVLHTPVCGHLPTLLSAHPGPHSGPNGSHRTLGGQRERAVLQSICLPTGTHISCSSRHMFTLGGGRPPGMCGDTLRWPDCHRGQPAGHPPGIRSLPV